ncbi:MAG TPA: cytochrome c-type biogenesis protein CcmH [Solirubrobacterales bacterium]|nr:cytochrome c-type biogenesis protein CcmH [Solirubrobacterales bacterium]
MKRLLAIALALMLLPGTASAATPQTSISDVEDEVMCPICGTLLELAESPQAQRERALVKRLIAAGRSKAEIKDALVAEYGREVLALPSGSGFDLSAYLVPAIAFVAAVIALALGVRRWHRAAKPPGGGDSGAASGPRGEDAERLEADIARYDL